MSETWSAAAARLDAGRPWLLLDIDGVLNPSGDHAARGFVPRRLHGYDVQLSAGHGRMLNELDQEGLVDLRWATTWNEAANRYVAPAIGLRRELPIVPIDRALAGPVEYGYNWKAESVHRATPGIAFAWLDDFLTPADQQWAEARVLESGTPTLLVRVDPKVGLLPGHLDKVRAWALSIRSRDGLTADELLQRTPALAGNPVARERADWFARTARALPAHAGGTAGVGRTDLMTSLWDRCASAIVAEYATAPGAGGPVDAFARQAVRRYLRGDGDGATIWAGRAALRAGQPLLSGWPTQEAGGVSRYRLVLPADPAPAAGNKILALIDSAVADLGVNPAWQRTHRSVQLGPQAPLVLVTARADRDDISSNLTVSFGHHGDAEKIPYEHVLRDGPAGLVRRVSSVTEDLRPRKAGPARAAGGWRSSAEARGVAALPAIFGAYHLNTDQQQAVRDAYEAAKAGGAPLIVSTAARMLPDLRNDVQTGHHGKIVFLGRDGHSFAAAVRGLDPEFFRNHCTEIVLSRALLEAAMQDLENNAAASFPQAEGFRSRERAAAGTAGGAYRQLTDYLDRNGIPVAGSSGAHITIVDIGVRGTPQELLAAMYPEATFTGRYAIFIENPADPHPGSKFGYVIHEGRDSPLRGNYLNELPAEPALTFAQRDAIRVIEDTLSGPLTSPARWTGAEPAQQPQRMVPDQLAGFNLAVVSPRYRDPAVREAVKVANLLAVSDVAEDAARLRAAGQDFTGPLTAAASRFTTNVRSWIRGSESSDPRLGEMLDSFVLRPDRPLNQRLASLIERTEIQSPQASVMWKQLASLRSLEAKENFIRGLTVSMGFPRGMSGKPSGRPAGGPAQPARAPSRPQKRPDISR